MIDAVHELIDDLSETPEKLRAIFAEAGDIANGTNEEWGPIEMVAHMAIIEKVYRDRITEVLAKITPYLRTFDVDAAAAEHDYASIDAQTALDRFADERSDTIVIMVNLALKDWARTGIHDEMGEVSVEDLASELCIHDEEMLPRIEAALAKA